MKGRWDSKNDKKFIRFYEGQSSGNEHYVCDGLFIIGVKE